MNVWIVTLRLEYFLTSLAVSSSVRKEFMRTLIKNPTKLLIILERSKGERSIPEMDKVLDRLEDILN